MADTDFATIVFNEPGQRKLHVLAAREHLAEAIFGGLLPEMEPVGESPVHPWLIRKSIKPNGQVNYVEVSCFDDEDTPTGGPRIRCVNPANVATIE